MYFYSPVATRSFSEVETSTDPADKTDEITNYDNEINCLLEHEHIFIKTVISSTCEDKGYTLYTCEICDESYSEDYVDAIGHNYDFTGYNAGAYFYKCTDCSKTCSRSKNELPEFINAKDFAEINRLAK